MATNQKVLKEDAINYLWNCGFIKNTLIDYIRSSKSTKGIKRALSRELLNTMCNEDLDLCKTELKIIKQYNFHELKRWYDREYKDEMDKFYKENPWCIREEK